MKTVLEMKNVKKIYGQRSNVFTALHGIDMKIKKGEFVGIMGPSGAGKTTLLNLISTIDKPTSGTIIVDNQDIVKMKESQLTSFRRNKLGFIFQDYNLLSLLRCTPFLSEKAKKTNIPLLYKKIIPFCNS